MNISAKTENQDAAEFIAAAQELQTIRDFVRWGVSRFEEAGLFYGHGTDNAMDEAVFIVLEALRLPIDQLQPYWEARLTAQEKKRIAALYQKRITDRCPAPYLVNKAYLQGFGFYVDERVIVPRSYIAEILFNPEGFSQIPDYNAVSSVLDLCTGSGCLAIIAAHCFPNATIDAVDLSPDAADVARRNVSDYGLEDRVQVHCGDLFAPLAGRKYELIITNPPYVDREGMAALPEEFRSEPEMALGAGDDGLDIVHRILKNGSDYMNDGGGILCELGRCGPALEDAYPVTPFLWTDTETMSGEVFWLPRNKMPR